MKTTTVQQLDSYEKLYKRKLSEDEKAEMRYNLVGFFELLLEIEKESKKREK